jgi:hypothetical protein
MSWAVAAVGQYPMDDWSEEDSLPDGKTSFSLTMTCLRKGAARNTLVNQGTHHSSNRVNEPKESD